MNDIVLQVIIELYHKKSFVILDQPFQSTPDLMSIFHFHTVINWLFAISFLFRFIMHQNWHFLHFHVTKSIQINCKTPPFCAEFNPNSLISFFARIHPLWLKMKDTKICNLNFASNFFSTVLVLALIPECHSTLFPFCRFFSPFRCRRWYHLHRNTKKLFAFESQLEPKGWSLTLFFCCYSTEYFPFSRWLAMPTSSSSFYSNDVFSMQIYIITLEWRS